ncbi:hypothetical protein MTO96_033755 [Rhipicephalus appendiculatus]
MGIYYACLINNYADPACRECGVMFLVLWCGQRFAAAYAGTNDELRTLTTALHIALLGERVELLLGLHADLLTAYYEGCQNVGGTFLFRSDRSNMVQHFWNFDQPEGRVDHSIAPHRQGHAP